MDFNLMIQFIKPETLIVVVSCYAFGMFLKSSKMNDWMIPFVLLIFGILLSILYMAFVLGDGLTIKVIITGLIQGLLAASLAVYGNQVIKQIVEKR